MHERGKYIWNDGRKYDGGYSYDRKHGFGIYTWNDGRRYEGYWHNGKQNGEAQYILSDGESRIGEWGEGKRLRWLQKTTFERPADFDSYIFKGKTELLITVKKFKFSLEHILIKLKD